MYSVQKIKASKGDSSNSDENLAMILFKVKVTDLFRQYQDVLPKIFEVGLRTLLNLNTLFCEINEEIDLGTTSDKGLNILLPRLQY